MLVFLFSGKLLWSITDLISFFVESAKVVKAVNL